MASTSFALNDNGLTVAEVFRNLAPSVLYEHAIRFEKDATIAENGALVAYSGVKTGRSPKDKRVVENPASKNDRILNYRFQNRPTALFTWALNAPIEQTAGPTCSTTSFSLWQAP